MSRDYENYHIPDLIADLRDDALSLKSKLELFDKLRRFFSVFSIVWSYVSIALFTVYGITHLMRTGEVVLPVISFCVCGVFLVVNTVLLSMRSKSKEGGKRYATAKRTFRLITVLLKLAMTAITIASLVGITDDPSVGLRTTWCVISMFWLGLTVAVDVAGFIIRRVLKILKEIATERIKRTKAAFSSTTGDVVKIARTVKDIGAGIKNAFSGRKKDKETDKEDENIEIVDQDIFD